MRGHARAAFLLAIFLLLGCEREASRVTASTYGSPFVERVVEPRRASDGQPPLLVLMHGIGADENDLLPIASLLDPKLKVVSLRAPQRYVVGYAWFQIDFRPDGTIQPDLLQAKASLADLTAWLEHAPERHHTDPSRTYVLGFSQGAMMTLGLLKSVPDRLAGAIVLSGRDSAGMFEATADRDAVARVPLLVAHGTYDDLLPIEHGRATRDAFQGWSKDFTYREFPVAHGVSEDEIALIADWLDRHLQAR